MARTRTLAVVSLLAVVATATVGVADAAKKKPSCKPRKEQKGCKLGVPALYTKAVNAAQGQHLFARTFKGGFSVATQDRANRNSLPKQGSVCGNTVVPILKGAKIGKSYKFNTTKPTPFSITDMSGKIKFKSAKKATLTGTVKAYSKHPTTRAKDQLVCTFNLKSTLKRAKL